MNVEDFRRIRVALAIVFVAAALAACGSALKELEQMPEQDAIAVAGVKAALVRELQVDAAAIQITIVDGQLVLEGYVDSAEESQLTADIAGQNANGLDVLNHLEVR